MAGAREMRASAGLKIETFDFDGAKSSLARNGFAGSGGREISGGAEANGDDAILENNLVDATLGFGQMT